MDELQKLSAAYATHRGMEHTRSYVARGRALATIPTSELEARWVHAFTAVCHDGDYRQSREMRDAGAEFSLRKIEQPYHLVKNLMPAIFERVSSMNDDDDRLDTDMSSFIAELDKPRN
jgi:hypothetical protein